MAEKEGKTCIWFSIALISLHFLLLATPITASGTEVMDSLLAVTEQKQGVQQLESYWDLIKLARKEAPESLSVYVDRGIQLAENLNNPELTAKTFDKSGRAYFKLSRNEKARQCYERSSSIFDSLGLMGSAAESYRMLGITHAKSGHLGKALQCFRTAEGYWTALGDSSKISGANLAIGNVYYYLGDYEKTIEWYLKALEISKNNMDPFQAATILGNIGTTYSDLEDYPKAIEYLNRAMDMIPIEENPVFHANNLNNLGSVYESMNQLDKALECFQNAITLYEKSGDHLSTAYPMHNIGLIDIKQEKYKEALDILSRSLKIQESINDAYTTAKTNIEVGRVYLELNQPERAKHFIEKGLAISLESDLKSSTSVGYLMLSRYYENRGDYKNALEQYRLYKTVNDSIYDERKMDQIAKLQTRYETQQKEEEIELLKSEQKINLLTIRRQSLIRNILIAGLSMLLLFSAVLSYTIVKLKRARSELKMLTGMLPICANCKKIRDDQGYWNQLESYISQHSSAEFSHGICPDCARELYGEFLDDEK